jgi:hypothetical protein
LGGGGADFESHVLVVAETIHAILHPLDLRSFKATDILFDHLVRDRPDHIKMLGCIAAMLAGDGVFIAYFNEWISGHFYSHAQIGEAFTYYSRRLRTRFPPTFASQFKYRLRVDAQQAEAA